jgi:hypothetical protein
MIPQGGSLNNQPIKRVTEPSRTYALNPETGRITGLADGLDAVRQAAMKILGTERFEHLIYSGNYGVELQKMNRDRRFLSSELKRRIQEALLQDDRIRSVGEIRITYADDSATVDFSIQSVYGDVQLRKELKGLV